MQKKIAVISDIHGNNFALQAVLEDLEKQHVDTVLNLGDSLYGPINPRETFKLIAGNSFISISGNQDRFILENEEKREVVNPTLTFVLNSLPGEAFDWLKTLEPNKAWENLYLCHGNFQQDDAPLIEKFEDGKVTQKSHKELENEAENVKQDIILCGHTHVPKVLKLSASGKFIINPGSVGLAAYDDESPFYHRMESGSPFAKYVVIELEEELVVSISQRHVRYDHERAAQQADRYGRSDWAYWIRKGKMN